MNKKEIYIDFLYNRIIYKNEDRTEEHFRGKTRDLLFESLGLFLSKMRVDIVRNSLKEGNYRVHLILSNIEEEKFNLLLSKELEKFNNMTIDQRLDEVKSPLAKALMLVNIEFKDKVDKGGNPYIDHLRHVFYKTRDSFPDDIDMQCAAILHDVKEDLPDWTKERLLKHFNERTVNIIMHLTKLPEEEYMDYINDKVKALAEAVSIKIEDLEHNMDITRLKEINDRTFKSLQKYHKAWKTLKSYEKYSIKQISN